MNTTSTGKNSYSNDSSTALRLLDSKRRHDQWQKLPPGMRNTYDSLNRQLPAICNIRTQRHRHRLDVTRVALTFIFLISSAFNLQALTRSYNYRFVAHPDNEHPSAVVERINALFL